MADLRPSGSCAACRVLSDVDGRIGCVTPLQYADADNVVVWVRPLIESRFEVTDYGEALTESMANKGADSRALDEFAKATARGQGVKFVNGRLTVQSDWDALGETVWRVATAATQLGRASRAVRPKQKQAAKESEFVSAVEHGLRSFNLRVDRDHRLDGASGHPTRPRSTCRPRELSLSR